MLTDASSVRPREWEHLRDVRRNKPVLLAAWVRGVRTSGRGWGAFLGGHLLSSALEARLAFTSIARTFVAFVCLFVCLHQLELLVLPNGPCGDSPGPSSCWDRHLRAGCVAPGCIGSLPTTELSAWGQKMWLRWGNRRRW